MQIRFGGTLGRVTAGLLLLASVGGCADLTGSTRQVGELRGDEATAMGDLKTAYKLCVVYNAIRIDQAQSPADAPPSQEAATSAALEAVSGCERHYELIEDYAFDLRLDTYARKQVTRGLTGEAIEVAEKSVTEVRGGGKPAYVQEVYADAGATYPLFAIPGYLWDKFESGWKTATGAPQ
jgi:type II secretory pathway component GspD/PulD (secretin)